MRDLLDAPSSEEDVDYDSPQQDRVGAHQGFIFGYSSLMVDLRELHPTPSQIFILWEVFKENVDPVVRILHRPTAKNILMNAASNLDRVSRAAEALLFAVYLGAVVSLSPEQCQQLLDESKETLLHRYRFATEQALARADFLNSSSLMCLQALVFFLIFVRHSDDSRTVWALGGLAIRLGQGLGVHRDGTHFNLNPFDTEMRRRLWWHISILDNRSAEDHGTDSTLTEQLYDTKLPMNLNDEDIYPEMKEWPTERQGATEMTFCLIRFELNIFNRKLNCTAPILDPSRTRERTLQEKEQMIDACHKKIEDKYLRYCDMTLPIYWVSATVARLILAKMWLMVHHPGSFRLVADDGSALSSETKHRLFITSVEVIEFSHLLEENENTAKWGWLFRTYMQWQSVAFVLSEICVRPPGPDVDRAWRAIESVYDERLNGNARNQRGMLWKPLRHLMAKARARRAAQNLDTTGATATAQSQDSLSLDRWMQDLPRANTLSPTMEPQGLDFDSDLARVSQRVEGKTGVVHEQNSSRQSSSRPTWGSPEQISPPSTDLLNFACWTPSVGDFHVAPEPMQQFFINLQQEWF